MPVVTMIISFIKINDNTAQIYRIDIIVIGVIYTDGFIQIKPKKCEYLTFFICKC